MAYMDGNILDEEFVGTQANWDIEDAVIELGLVVLTQDTDILKLGNGINTFADLEELVNINNIAELINIASYIDTTLTTEYFEKLAYFDSSPQIQRSDYIEDDFFVGDDYSEIQGVMTPLVCGYVQKTYGTSFTLNADSISAYREKGGYIDHYEWTSPEGAVFTGMDMTISIPDDPELVGTFLRYKCVAVDILGNRSSETYYNVLISDIDGPALDVSWGVQDPLISEISWDDDVHYENGSYVMTITPTEIDGLDFVFSVGCDDQSVTIVQRADPNDNVFDITYGEYHSNTPVIYTITVTNGSDLSCSIGNVKTVIDKAPTMAALSWDNDEHLDNHSYVLTVGATDPRLLDLTYEVTCNNGTVGIVQRAAPNEHIFDVTYPDYDHDTPVIYTVTVTNTEDMTDINTTIITVRDQVDNPVIDSVTWDTEDQYESDSYVMTIGATDPQSLDLTYEVECSDGDVVISQRSAPFTHIFDITYGEYDENTVLSYTITVTNTNPDEAIAVESMIVQNTAADPVINDILWNINNQFENHSYFMTIDATDPNNLDLSYEVTCNDPSVSVVQRSGADAHIFDVTYGEYGGDTEVQYTITVTNEDTLFAITYNSMTIQNVAPIINGINWSDDNQFENNSYIMAINAADPAGLELTYDVTCDDGDVVISQRSSPFEYMFDVTYGEYDLNTNLTYAIVVENAELVSTTTYTYMVVQNEALPPIINDITWDEDYQYESNSYVMTIDAIDPFLLSLTYEVTCSDGTVGIVQRTGAEDHMFDITYGAYDIDTNIQFDITVTNSSEVSDDTIEPKTVHDLDLSGVTGIFGGGSTSSSGYGDSTIDYITISSTGNAIVFGTLSIARAYVAATSNGAFDRAVFAGGYNTSTKYDRIDYVNIVAHGNAIDFGNLSINMSGASALSNRTNERGVFLGGYGTVYIETSEYITISTPGNTLSFGDMSTAKNQAGATSNGTNDRGVIGGGYNNPNYYNAIEFITISTIGNTSEFGDLTTSRSQLTATSNGTNERGIFAGGKVAGLYDIIDYVTISTIGNALDFGDLSANRRSLAAASNATDERAVFGGGYSDTAIINILEYVTINSLGNATDFGDLTQLKFGISATANV